MKLCNLIFGRKFIVVVQMLYRGVGIRTTPFWVAVQQFLISLSSSFFEKKVGVVQFQTRYFITWKCRILAMFYFWNIGNRCYTKSGIRFGFTLKPGKHFSFGPNDLGIKFKYRPFFRKNRCAKLY